MPKIWDSDNNGTLIDLASTVIQVPQADEVLLKDSDEYMARLKEITKPSELMFTFLQSALNPYYEEPTYEGRLAFNTGLVGFGTGWIFGGLMNTRGYHEEYRRNHNASVFDNSYRARRHHFDTFIFKIAGRGFSTGFKVSLLCLATGFISLGSISVRNDLYYPDWALGFAGLGAISRSWLGLRGLVAGAGFGLLGGTFGYGIVRACEFVSGKTVIEFRYHEEMEARRKREALRRACQIGREKWVNDKFIGE